MIPNPVCILESAGELLTPTTTFHPAHPLQPGRFWITASEAGGGVHDSNMSLPGRRFQASSCPTGLCSLLPPGLCQSQASARDTFPLLPHLFKSSETFSLRYNNLFLILKKVKKKSAKMNLANTCVSSSQDWQWRVNTCPICCRSFSSCKKQTKH